MNIYNKIKKLSDDKNLSILGLEKNCGLANATIKRWQTQAPSAISLYKVAAYLDTPMEHFVYDEAVEQLRPTMDNSTNISRSSINAGQGDINIGSNQTINKGVSCQQNCKLIEKYSKLSEQGKRTVESMLDLLTIKVD